MALPDNELSSTPISAPMEFQKEKKVARRSDFEYGGTDLNDASDGLLVQEWNVYISDDLTQIIAKDEAENETVLYTGTGLTAVSCTFDQNMRPTYAFIEEGDTKLNWYDSTIPGFVVTNYGTTYFWPKVSLDDKRDLQSSASDIIFAYVRNDNLYMRVQRDRFLTEYLLYSGVVENELGELQCIGMQRNKRFGFQFRTPSEISDW